MIWTVCRKKIAIVSLLWLAVTACTGTTEQRISERVTISSEWSEVVPPAPLRVAKTEQAVILRLAEVPHIESDAAIELDGRSVALHAEVVDDRGTVYPMALGGVSGNFVLMYRAGNYPPGPDFPTDRTIVKLRLRSDVRLDVEAIRWVCSTAR